jgi:hypothetical protein
MRVQIDNTISYDDQTDIVEIYGVRYAASLFRQLTIGPIGSTFRLVQREDGMVTLQSLSTPAKVIPVPPSTGI